VRRPLSKRIATWILLTIARNLWGLPVGLMPVLVDRLGAFGALRWMVGNLPRYEKMLKEMGPLRGHLVATFVSMLNGCYYCAYAHARSFELHFFRSRQALFPLDEHQMVDLIVLPDQEVQARLEAAFQRAQLPEGPPLFARLVQMKYGSGEAEPAGADDRHLRHAIQMFEVLNFCGISTAVPLDGAHDPINKDQDLKARYAQARLERRPLKGEQGAPPGSSSG
jgi:hypothetical protein